ncbi:MAG TPA: family 78 glycoside hydrolase catalytic domain [Naasia sp.]|jgi:alpha-L-rhamnosidase
MTHIEYDGAPLRSRDRVDWSVTLWDGNGTEGRPQTSWFEMGLLEPSDWTARWISGAYTPKRNRRYPVDCFRRDFALPGPVARARLHIAACGLYEARINGRRVGDVALAPGSTDYRHRIHYQTYDVLPLLADVNSLEIQLADGWYRGSLGAFGPVNVFGRQTKLLAQLELTHEDGSVTTIGSGDTFRWSNDGPLRFADLQDGEAYDARLAPSFRGRAKVVTEKLTPTAADNVVAREKEILTPQLLTTPSGKRVLDFGQNIAGFLGFDVEGEPGQRITLRLGEILDEHGEFTQANFQEHKPVKEPGRLTSILLVTGQAKRIRGKLEPTPQQEITFTCSGGPDSYRTTFAVFGFRYVLVDTDLPIDPTAFRAVAVYSDMEQTGDFTCSNDEVNRLVENTRWSMKGNFLDVPTDCPTRERLGWTGDAQVFFDTAADLMDVAAFYRKWLRDLQDSQLKSGKLSAVAPYSGLAMVYDSTGGTVGWGDASILVPYRHWKRYGDDRILREFYGMMRGYAMFMIGNTGHKDRRRAKANPHNAYVYEKGVQLGEWLEPEEFRDPVGVRVKVLHTEVATAYLSFTMRHLAEIAEHLGETSDAAMFDEYAQGAKRAYAHLFLADGAIDTDRQAKLVRPLALGLVEGDIRKRIEERLVDALERRGHRIGTGFLSTPFVLPVLTDAGHADVAYKVLQNPESPSWIAEVRAGATTIWEDWEGKLSQNHYSPGAVCHWLFDTVAGIRVAGENHFLVAPVPGGGLTSAAARHASIYGEVTSRWEATGDGIRLDVVIPPNCSADVRLPDGRRTTVTAGSHSFELVDGRLPAIR